MDEVRCAKCGATFEENKCAYGGSDWCPKCRPEKTATLIDVRKKATEQFSRLPRTSRDEADRKAQEFTSQLERDMANRDRKYKRPHIA